MLSDDRLSASGAVVSFVQTVIEKVWNAAALADKTANGKGPHMCNVTSFLVDYSLNRLFAALTSDSDWGVVHFGVVSEISKKLRLDDHGCLGLLVHCEDWLRRWLNGVDVLVSILIGVDWLLEVWLLVWMRGLHFILDGVANGNTTSEL